MLDVKIIEGGQECQTINSFCKNGIKWIVLLQKGYKIKKVTENLNGALVDFEKGKNTETLHIVTAEGRKYFSVKLIQQQKAEVYQIENGDNSGRKE